jgi:predicted phage-related endonuclease
MHAPLIERRPIVDRDEWLAWRRDHVTASVIGALFGADVHPYTTALRLYAEQRGVEFQRKENKAMRRGRWLEPAVAKAVSELRPDWHLEGPNVYLVDPALRLGATPDFFIHDDPRGLGVLQCKTVEPGVFARQWSGGAEPPFWVILQCATEMMLADAAFGAIAALVLDPFDMDCVIHEVPRSSEVEAKIVAAVQDFWRAVATGDEPRPDFAADAAVIAAMAPRPVPFKTIDLRGNNAVPILLDERARILAEISAGEKRCDEIEAEIKYLFGDAEVGMGLPGWRITYKMGARAGYTVPPKSDIRTLRIYDRREKESAQ